MLKGVQFKEGEKKAPGWGGGCKTHAETKVNNTCTSWVVGCPGSRLLQQAPVMEPDQQLLSGERRCCRLLASFQKLQQGKADYWIPQSRI